MSSPTVLALTGLLTWALALLVLMEIIRSARVVSGQMPASQPAAPNAWPLAGVA